MPPCAKRLPSKDVHCDGNRAKIKWERYYFSVIEYYFMLNLKIADEVYNNPFFHRSSKSLQG